MSAESGCWEDLLRMAAEKICWEWLLRMAAEKSCWEWLCWEELLWELLRRAAESGCWEWLWIKTSLKISSSFYAGWVWLTPAGNNPLVTSWSSDAQNCGEMRILHMSLATLSSLRGRRTPKTVVKCKFITSRAQPSRHFVLIGRPKLWWNANLSRRRSNPLVTSWLSDVQNCGETQILKPRTKRSFWKLFLWKLSEASRETFVLEACSVKFGGSLARNDRFGLCNLVLVAAFSY